LYGAGDKVIDIDHDKIVGDLPPHTGHGFAIAPELGRGMGRRGIIFDLTSLAPIGQIPVDGDAVVYDARLHRAFFLNGETTVVDLETQKVVGDFDMVDDARAAVESGVDDGDGHIFVNVVAQRDTASPIIAQIVTVDVSRMTATAQWPMDSCLAPQGIALDAAHHRLFVGCVNALVVVNSNNGAVVTTMPLKGHADALAFDAALQLVLYPTGNGTVAVIHEDSPDRYRLTETVDAAGGGASLALDTKTHHAYLFANSGKALKLIVMAP
jgi:hypothetical protein